MVSAFVLSANARTRAGRAPRKGGLARFDPGSPRLIILGLLAFVFFVAKTPVTSLHVPIVGEHDWRQADTYSVAYNFVHASFDFMRPRIDWTYGRSGVMGMEAPVLPFLGAACMTLFGDEPAVLRTIVFACFALGLIAFARSLRSPFAPAQWIGTLVVAVCSPMALFESRQIQPDPFMCAMLMLSAAALHRFSKEGARRDYVLGLCAYNVAILVKSPAIVAGPALFLLSFSAAPPRFRAIVARGAGFLVPLVLVGAWSLWGKHLNETYNGGEVYFATEFDLDVIRADLSSRAKLRNIMLFVLPIYTVGWVTMPAVFAGMVLGFSRMHRAIALPMWVWLLASTFFLACFGGRLTSHWYYALPALPPLLWFGGLGIGNVLGVISGATSGSRIARACAAVVVLALPLADIVGGEPRTGNGVPGAAGAALEATWLTDGGLFAFLLIVVLAFGVSVPPLGIVRRVGIAIVFVGSLYFGLGRAYTDVTGVFDLRAKTSQWSSFHSTWDPLRRATDAYSTRADVFVTDMGNPWYLYLANRRGFADPAGTVSSHGPSAYRRRGARFYVHYRAAGPLPLTMHDLPELAKGPEWTLYCLDRRGCPRREP